MGPGIGENGVGSNAYIGWYGKMYGECMVIDVIEWLLKVGGNE